MGKYSIGMASHREITTVQVNRDLHQRLKEIRPFKSMSFNDLIEDMADQYDPHAGPDSDT